MWERTNEHILRTVVWEIEQNVRILKRNSEIKLYTPLYFRFVLISDMHLRLAIIRRASKFFVCTRVKTEHMLRLVNIDS